LADVDFEAKHVPLSGIKRTSLVRSPDFGARPMARLTLSHGQPRAPTTESATAPPPAPTAAPIGPAINAPPTPPHRAAYRLLRRGATGQGHAQDYRREHETTATLRGKMFILVSPEGPSVGGNF